MPVDFDWNKPSKSIKTKLRAIIERGLERDFQQGLMKAEEVLSKWKNREIGTEAAYRDLYRKVQSHDKIIDKRYGDMCGSQYCMIVTSQLMDGLIDEQELDVLGESIKEKFVQTAEVFGRKR
jgi:hypothetical protein